MALGVYLAQRAKLLASSAHPVINYVVSVDEDIYNSPNSMDLGSTLTNTELSTIYKRQLLKLCG